jgi:hypothetical protein
LRSERAPTFGFQSLFPASNELARRRKALASRRSTTFLAPPSHPKDGNGWFGVVIVSKQDGLTFGLAGLVAFFVSTAYYAAFGAGLLESAFWFYAANAFMVGGVAVFLFYAVTRLRRPPRSRRLLAAAVFAAPGLVGSAVMLALFKDIFPQWDPVSLGRYGAFMLVGHALLAAAAFDQSRARQPKVAAGIGARRAQNS